MLLGDRELLAESDTANILGGGIVDPKEARSIVEGVLPEPSVVV